jgi:hypothetical protein
MVDRKKTEGVGFYLIARITFEDETIPTEWFKYPSVFESKEDAISFGKKHLKRVMAEMPHVKYTFHEIQ